MNLEDVTITFLGHATFLIERGDFSLLIDPWLTGNPSCPEEHHEAEADLVVLTHGHNDHIGDALAVAHRCGAHFVAIHELGKWLTGKGVPDERVHGANRGGSIHFDEFGVTITLTDARHSSAYVEEDGTVVPLGEPCGVVVTFDDGPAIYHAGDTSLFGDMAIIGELWQPDVAILPIGDRFTMDPRQAAFATDLIDPNAVIPCHYGTFPLLTGTPEDFRTELIRRGLAGIDLIVLDPGETLD